MSGRQPDRRGETRVARLEEAPVDYSGLIKTIDLPDVFTPPTRLVYEDIRATAITRDDLDDDVLGINASVDLIRRTRGGGWPTGPVTAEDNYADLVWHELEFREGYSFTYVIRDADGRYLGCCYLYPVGRRVPMTEELARHDVDVSWWVTAEGFEQGYYTKVHDALRRWTGTDFPFRSPYFSNTEIPEAGTPA
jgi:RimJ/RimL family protein N-acetyltransferase